MVILKLIVLHWLNFPQNFKFTKCKKEDSSSGVHNVASISIGQGVLTSPHMNFTAEQYRQLLQLLSNNNINSSQVNSSISKGACNSDGKKFHSNIFVLMFTNNPIFDISINHGLLIRVPLTIFVLINQFLCPCLKLLFHS